MSVHFSRSSSHLGQKLCEWPGQKVTSALGQSKKIVLVPLGDCPEVDTEALARVLRAFYYGMSVEVFLDYRKICRKILGIGSCSAVLIHSASCHKIFGSESFSAIFFHFAFVPYFSKKLR